MDSRLSEHFIFAAGKSLSAVDAVPSRSNQHEIGGLVKVGFGDAIGNLTPGEKLQIPCLMIWLSDDDDNHLITTTVTWYDARAGKAHRTPEYRLYYPSNDVTERIGEGDFLLTALRHNNELVLCFVPKNSQIEWQLRSLFGLATGHSTDHRFHGAKLSDKKLLLPVRIFLEEIGIIFDSEVDPKDTALEWLLSRYPNGFPASKVFSELARERVGLHSVEAPDETLMAWLEEEEMLFRVMERHIVKQQLLDGFGAEKDDVDAFIQYSLSVHNRRKSRVGFAFENHLETIFKEHSLPFEKGSRRNVTENNSKPDFLFPSFSAYHEKEYPQEKLFLLAAKTTCKDRWRQVLAEAARIPKKHLITLQSLISSNQLEEMRYHQLQLVIPSPVLSLYSSDSQTFLMPLYEFIDVVKNINSKEV
ncbi:type II restriction endonuclease [Klebsiella sp. GG_Kp154]|uniref:type II restriction endonuclease n=1 Tax=Klebsiella TaxID=570 RepID=UPI000DAE1D93|nr:type II restriction endonuclease [Klebsiella variicola]EIX9713469.1 restriction endonuclease [Klebsiella pneumoniae]EKX8075317.1 restriction endonuclease [Escherichia coli]PZZ90357.1 restriction endonuclease [Klebsiella variicola]HCD1335513.1 restriction endonuclease [Klebsiella variicola subsp. variicola]